MHRRPPNAPATPFPNAFNPLPPDAPSSSTPTSQPAQRFLRAVYRVAPISASVCSGVLCRVHTVTLPRYHARCAGWKEKFAHGYL